MQHVSELVAELGEWSSGGTLTGVFSRALAQSKVCAPVQHQPGREPFEDQGLIEPEHLHCSLNDARELSQSCTTGFPGLG